MAIFTQSPIIHATKQLIKWMQLRSIPTSSSDFVKLENEILEEFMHLEKVKYLQNNIPFQLYKVLFYFHKQILKKDSLKLLKDIFPNKVEPKVLFCSTIVNRFSLQYFENGEIQTIPLFRNEILDLLNELELCPLEKRPEFSFNDLVQLSRGDYPSLTLKIKKSY